MCIYFYMCLSFQGAKYTHIWGYEWVGQWRWGDGLHAELDWGVWRAPLEVVSADIHPIPKEGGPLSSFTLSGWLE